ncbi:hypothetical protein TNCV_4355951 [Trichonephila clavipes]|nr:hypothetical protein TNCV_4355951 [Trichonephila clavipes]
MTHSSHHLYRVSSNTCSKRGIEPGKKLWQFTKFPQHKNRIKQTPKQNQKKSCTIQTTGMGGLLTSLDAEDGSLWGTARAFRKRPPRSPPLMAPTASLSVTQTKLN